MKLHNTLTKKTEYFKPISEGRVLLYTCGPTVYSTPHIGNWVAYIYWDLLVRVLTTNGYAVNRVMNITDVGHLVSDEDDGEDKMQKGAEREGLTAWDVADKYTAEFLSGMKKLNLVTPQHLARATDFIDQQIELVRKLKAKGYTYQTSDGIYFDTSKFPNYADFAHLDLDAQKAGARVTRNPEKRNSSDFALWKFSPAGKKRDMEWPTPADLTDNSESPMGFPGWHLECSAMAMNLLGETIDIHTGGIDHIPVHHSNEIAQSEAASGVRFSNFWLHNNHLKVDGGKISKSLGNGYSLEQIAERGFNPMDFKLFVLQSHYSAEGNFSFENLEAAQNRLRAWRDIASLRHQIHNTLDIASDDTAAPYVSRKALLDALNDDLNSPKALAIIDQAFDGLPQQNIDKISRPALVDLLEDIDSLLGLNLVESTPDISDDAKKLIIERERVRENKDWARSDELRDKLASEFDINVRDTLNGTVWTYC